MGVERIFRGGDQNHFSREGQQWWNFISATNSKPREKHFFTKEIIGKYQISQSRGEFDLPRFRRPYLQFFALG